MILNLLLVVAHGDFAKVRLRELVNGLTGRDGLWLWKLVKVEVGRCCGVERVDHLIKLHVKSFTILMLL